MGIIILSQFILTVVELKSNVLSVGFLSPRGGSPWMSFPEKHLRNEEMNLIVAELNISESPTSAHT